MNRVRTLILMAAAVLAPIGFAGCHPFSMGFATPIPVPVWVTERMEEKYCWQNDFRTPIMPPIKEGVPPPMCEDPPDQARILRAWPHVRRGVFYFAEEFRDNVETTAELIVDKIDPPRFFPLIGPAQLHHCHWKCSIYWVETFESGYPFPFRCVKPKVQVVYIDLDHLHLYPCPDPNVQQSVTRDLINQ